MRNIKNILLVLLPILYIIISVSFTTTGHDGVVCKTVRIRVLDSMTNTFINPADIFFMLEEEGISLTGKRMAGINGQEIEDFIDKHPSILKSECYKTINGTYRIDIMQRRPLIRVISHTGNFYIDSNGEIMPFSKHYTAFVPVVTGSFDVGSMHSALYELGLFLDQDSFWKAQVSQIHIKNANDVVLIPRVGNHEIEFGSLQNLSSKFARVKALYELKFNTEGWNRYKKISVKFENQVVCTKK